MRKASWLVAGVLGGAALLLAPAESRAETRIGFGIFVGHDSRYDGGDDAYRVGYSRGYQEGLDHGAHDGDHHESFNFWHERRYRNADSGYKGWYGPKCDYQHGYRAGYERGYQRGYASLRDRDGRCNLRYGYARERGRDRDWDDDRDVPYDNRDRRY